ncbi:MAG: class A beta-lactamase [Parvularculaceae bacterium]|nr:class A beta-lactamase [Parvularculaceae bacterium]
MTRTRVLISRRTVIAGALAAPLAAPLAGCATAPAGGGDFAAVEARLGGRLGVFAHDLETGRSFARRADERFAMCSTFKWALAGLILRARDEAALSLDDPAPYGCDDLVSYSPVTEPALGEGRAMTIGEVCNAAVTLSDNTAANLLLARIGGPQGFTGRLRTLGDDVTRLDRWETALNENLPGDPRDTTTPRAMTALLQRFIAGDALNDLSRKQLADWMIAAKTGGARLRAGLPPGWVVGDKTGTSGNGANNDVAFALPHGEDDRAPILIASYINAPDADSAAANAAHADVARLVVEQFIR